MPKFGARTTAEQALDGRSLQGKTAIVTGASSGLGVETTRVLALAGADVIMAVRNVKAGEETAAALRAGLSASGAKAGKLTVEPLDLGDLTSVRAFTKARDRARPIHLLVANAGIMATPLGTTAQGFELQVGTNHLGHFELTRGLLPLLDPSARVVVVSSALHTRGRAARLFETLEGDRAFAKRPYVPFDAYGDSKLANVLFVKGLVKRLPSGVEAYALHPGVIPTPLSRSMGFMGTLFRSVGRLFMKTVAQGAATSVYACVAPELAGQSGAYLSDCDVATPSADARDAEAAERLWRVSEQCAGASG